MVRLGSRLLASIVLLSLLTLGVTGQQSRDAIRPVTYIETPPPVTWSPPVLPGKALPINLPTALRLADARAMDVAIATQRLEAASAQLLQAKAAWLPSVTAGVDYLRHDGRAQDSGGAIINPTRSALMAGAGVNAVFTPSDAVFAPLAARQVMRAKQLDRDAVANNTVLTVAESYFNIQQARGELVGAHIAVQHAQELVRRTEKLAEGLVLPVEAVRARTELARRKQAAHAVFERWQLASADLVRVLRLDPSALIDPAEPPHLRISLIEVDPTVDNLIPIALRNRPELASQQALIEATLQRLRQEKLRPLIPSLVLKGTGTNPPASLSGGVFGGGNDALGKYGLRGDVELQAVWEFQNLLFGNRAKIKERQAENQATMLELFRLQDNIAAEVVRAHAQARSAANRLADAESGLKDATESVDKNFQGLSQTRRAGDLLVLLVRPQEVVAAIQTLAQAYSDYYGAVGDYNRAQYRLYVALGCPAYLCAGR